MMLAAHERRFERIYRDFCTRPGGDYGELLRRGSALSDEGVDPEAWRDEIRRQARRDRLSVRTCRDGDRAVAVLNRVIPTSGVGGLLEREVARLDVVQRAEEQARALGHVPTDWLRDGDESITACRRCGAPVYVRVGADQVEDGEALTGSCPG